MPSRGGRILLELVEVAGAIGPAVGQASDGRRRGAALAVQCIPVAPVFHQSFSWLILPIFQA